MGIIKFMMPCLGFLLFSSHKEEGYLDWIWEVKHRCMELSHARAETDVNFFLQGVPGQPGTKGSPGDKVR